MRGETDGRMAEQSSPHSFSSKTWRRSDSIRAVVFVVVASFLVISPSIRQLFGVHNKYLREWAMFSRASRNYVVATFHTKGPSGQLEPVDRFELLGYPSRSKAPKWLRRIHTKRKMKVVVRKMCERLHDRGGLYVDARISHVDGWKTLYRSNRDRCLHSESGRR